MSMQLFYTDEFDKTESEAEDADDKTEKKILFVISFDVGDFEICFTRPNRDIDEKNGHDCRYDGNKTLLGNTHEKLLVEKILQPP
jgi:hypothetical protein